MKVSRVFTIGTCVLGTVALYVTSYVSGNKGIALLATMCALATIYVAAFPKSK